MIRPYRPSDQQALRDIAKRAFAKIWNMYRQKLGPELCEVEYPDCENRIVRNLDDQWVRFPEGILVFEKEGYGVVGFVTFLLKPEKKLGIIDDNAVHPDFQGEGIGTALYRAALDYMRKHYMKYAKVVTGLDDAHMAARCSYEKAGFDVKHEDVTYYRKL
jgi:ribosomal protein S18 acetylase RimI-like enzyme